MVADVFRPDAVSRALGVVGLVSMFVAVVALVVAHLRPTGLSPLRDAVSRYGISSAAVWYRTQTIAMALAAVVLSIAMERSLHLGGVSELVVLLVVFASARALISWYPMDAPGTPVSSHGSVHRLLAVVAFVSVTAASKLLNSMLSPTRVSAPWRHLSAGLSWTLIISLVLMLGARVSVGVRRRFGLFERLFYVSCIAWIVASCGAVALLRPS